MVDVENIQWEPPQRALKNISLVIKIPNDNMSNSLREAFQNEEYPENDVPDILELLQIVRNASEKSDVPVEIIRGLNRLEYDDIYYFEPYFFELPFKKVKFHLFITREFIYWKLHAIFEVQISDSIRFEKFKQELLDGTKGWLKNW